MRDDLTDLRQRVETGFTRVDNGFTEMRGKLDGAAAGQQQIVNLGGDSAVHVTGRRCGLGGDSDEAGERVESLKRLVS